MKKKLAALLLLGALSLQLVACGNDCKADGCDKEVYEDGYCEMHYFEKAITDALNF